MAGDRVIQAGSRPVSPAPLDLRAARNVLAVRLDNIGDVLMTGPALRVIRAAAPSARLTLLCSPAGAQAAALLPEVDGTIVARVAWQDVGDRLALDPDRELGLIARLRDGAFDAAFVFTSFSQSAYPPAFACYLAGIPVRVGQASDFGGSLLSRVVPPSPDGAHQVDRNLRVVAPLGTVADRALRIAIPPAAADSARATLRHAGIDWAAPYVAVAPGATAQARRYAPEGFAAVAARLAGTLGWPVAVVGGPGSDDAAAGAAIERAHPLVRSIVGRTTTAEWAAVIRDAALLVTSHSAPLHIADAVGTKVVCVFSGTDRESEWAPRTVPAALLRRPTDCAPCRLFDCPIGLPCLDVSPDEVVDAALALVRDANSLPERAQLEERWIASAS